MLDEETDPTRIETYEADVGARSALAWPAHSLAPVPSARHCLDGDTRVPSTVLEALVEASWALPGLRTSYARAIGRNRIRVVACAAPEMLATTCGRVVAIDPHWSEMLHDGETLVVGDALDEPIDERARLALVALGASSLCWAPLRATTEHGPSFAGIVALESSTPRAWTPTELAALERLVPLCELALDNATMTSTLQRARARLTTLQHRLDALHGVSAAVRGEGGAIVRALESLAASNPSAGDATAVAALADLLGGVLGELDPDVERPRVALDLAATLRELEPLLRAMLGSHVRVVSAPTPLWIRGHRITLVRAIVDIASHARSAVPGDGPVEIHGTAEGGGVLLRIRGAGLAADPSLSRLSTYAPATVDDLGLRLWIARCALVSHGAEIEVASEPDQHASITVALPVLS